MQNIGVKKKFGWRNWRTGFLIAGSWFVLAALAGEWSGYLASVGPAPLRFSVLPPPSTNVFVLPSATPTNEVELPPEEPAHVETPAVVTVVPEPPTVTNQINSTAPELTHPEEVVSPQMLIKYFNKSTNGVSTSVVAPLDFTPPKPPEPSAGSSATYSTGK